MTIGYDQNDWKQFQIKNPVEIVLPKKTSNILVSGKSGSGKSKSILWYIWQSLRNQESVVYLADYKAGEEYPFEDLSSMLLENKFLI